MAAQNTVGIGTTDLYITYIYTYTIKKNSILLFYKKLNIILVSIGFNYFEIINENISP